MPVNYAGLPDPSRPALAFQQGMAHAKAEREQEATRGALSAYAMNPDDPQAFQQLATYRPDLAIQIGEDRTKRQQAQQVADLQRRAASGDRTALAELAGIDLDAYDKLADNDRQAVSERVSVIGQAALRVSQLPPEQRPAAWDASIDQLATRFPELAEYKGQYSEEALMSAIDQAKQVTEFIGLERPSYQAIPEGGTLVNTRDPAAVQQFMGGAGAAPTPVLPSSAIEALRRGEGTPEQFDEMFGPGAAARALGNGGGAPSRVTSSFLGGL